MNKNRFRSDMEAAWELRPLKDLTPESEAHPRRFTKPKKTEEKESPEPKK